MEAAFKFCLNDHHKASRAVSARDIVPLSDALLALHLRATVAFHFLPAAAAIAASALDSVEFVFITKDAGSTPGHGDRCKVGVILAS